MAQSSAACAGAAVATSAHATTGTRSREILTLTEGTSYPGPMGLFDKRAKREQQELDIEKLRWLSKLAREDLLELGERLEDEAPPVEPDALAERAQARTLTAEARPRLREAETAEAVLAVQETIGRAFVHLARSDAIVRGEEPPTRTDPCEFNPQHGPATTEATWAAIGSDAHSFRCCQPDADLIAAGKTPRFRQIKVGSATVAWHDLGSAGMSRKEARAAVAGTYDAYAATLSSMQHMGHALRP